MVTVFIIEMIFLSVVAIMQSYYFTPWQAVKQKLKINKIPVLGSILSCAVCFTFWSGLIYFHYMYDLVWFASLKLSLINTIITVLLQEKFVKY